MVKKKKLMSRWVAVWTLSGLMRTGRWGPLSLTPRE